MDPFGDLPDELIHKITMNLPYDILSSLCLVSKRFSFVCEDNLFLTEKLRSDYGLNVRIKDSSKKVFQQLNTLTKKLNIQCNDIDESLLFGAIKEGMIELAIVLIEDKRVDPSNPNNNTITLALCANHIEVVYRLLQNDRVNPSANNNRAIILASREGYFDVVNRLLEDDRVNPSADNNRAIRNALKNDHLDVVNRLLQDPRVNIFNQG